MSWGQDLENYDWEEDDVEDILVCSVCGNDEDCDCFCCVNDTKLRVKK